MRLREGNAFSPVLANAPVAEVVKIARAKSFPYMV
jgi:hypothetical protein